MTRGPMGIKKGISEEVPVGLHCVRASVVQKKEHGRRRSQAGLGSNGTQALCGMGPQSRGPGQ